jgi:hypothetical protein
VLLLLFPYFPFSHSAGVGDCDASSAIMMATTHKLFQFLFKNKLDKEIFICTFCLWNPYQKV